MKPSESSLAFEESKSRINDSHVQSSVIDANMSSIDMISSKYHGQGGIDVMKR